MKKISLIIIAVLVIIGACSKDQKAVNWLDGTWKVTSLVENGVAQPDSSFKNSTYTFEKCKVKKGSCSGTLTDSGKSIPFTYKVSEKGKKITMTLFGFTQTGDILESSKTKFRWSFTEDGDVTETTIEKI